MLLDRVWTLIFKGFWAQPTIGALSPTTSLKETCAPSKLVWLLFSATYHAPFDCDTFADSLFTLCKAQFILFPWFSSVQTLSCVWLFATWWTTACQASLSITNSGSPHRPCPSSQWCHPMISSSVVPFSSCPQSFPASGSFQMSQLFASGGQSIGVSASTSVLPMNTQDWSPLEWTAWISLQAKGLSRVFSITTVQKHQFLGDQLSL